MSIAITTGTKKIKQALLEPTFYKVIQGGACFVAGTKVLMADGSYKSIENMSEGDKVLSKGEDGSIIKTEVKRAWYAGDFKPLLNIKVNGNWIKATYDHKFYTPRGYVELYKIVWGKMEESQRIQLKVLCEQYGQDIHLAPIWSKKKASHNKALCLCGQKERENERVLQNFDGRKKYTSPQVGCNNLVAKSKKQTASESYKWGDYRQQSGESRMGDQFRESIARVQNRIGSKEDRGRQYPLENDKGKSHGIENSVGHGRGEASQERICTEVWGIRSNNKGYFREQKLEAFAIDEIQVEEPQKVYSLEINHPTHNYFVSEANINVSNSASKTFSIMILLIGYAESYPNSLITVAGMTYNHLATGTMRDFKKIMQETNRWEDSNFNKSSKIYNFNNGSQIEFLSTDNMTSRGPRRDVLFVNEANGINYETFDQLATRTRDFVILDYNPSAKFWAHEELVEGKQKDKTTFLTLTYLDNEALSKQERENIESRKPKPGEEPSNYWIVYGLGQIGSLEGNIYSGWQEVDRNYFQNGKLVRYGLDFGFSNDETAMVAIYELEDGKTGVEEVLYQKGILGSQYAEILMSHNIDPNVLIVADSARPEIIAEIKAKGYRIVGADKNPGSVKRGIDRVSQRQIAYCGSNLKREYLSYAWRKKRSGEILDEPQDGNDHALDATRYAIDDLSKKRIEF